MVNSHFSYLYISFKCKVITIFHTITGKEAISRLITALDLRMEQQESQI